MKKLTFYRLNSAIWKFLDLIFPSAYACCGHEGSLFCDECKSKIKNTSFAAFLQGNKPIDRELNDPRFTQSQIKLLPYALFSSPIREALLLLKYRQDLGLEIIISDYPYQQFIDILLIQPEIFTTMPLGINRGKECLVDQTNVIDFPLALRMPVMFYPDLLVRIRVIPSRVGLSKFQRKSNAEGAFAVSNQAVGRSIFLIDDMLRIGSTIMKCAKSLIDAAARDVACFSIA